MPTAKPRVQVTFTTPQHELLRRLAELQKRSMGSIITELFEQVHPVLERVAVVLQAATRAQESMKDGLRESTLQAERDMRPLVAMAMGQLDLLHMDLVAASEPEASAAARGATPAKSPRLVTRGSGQPTRQPTNHARAIRRGSKSTKRAPARPKARKKS